MNINLSEKDILGALSTVLDPDIRRELVSLNIIRYVRIHADTIQFTVVLTTPACPLKEQIRQDCIRALKKVAGPNANIEANVTPSVTTRRDNAPLLPGVKNI